MEECPICEGAGKVWRVIAAPRRGNTVEGRFDCEECSGMGERPENEYVRDNGQFGVGA